MVENAQINYTRYSINRVSNGWPILKSISIMIALIRWVVAKVIKYYTGGDGWLCTLKLEFHSPLDMRTFSSYSLTSPFLPNLPKRKVQSNDRSQLMKRKQMLKLRLDFFFFYVCFFLSPPSALSSSLTRSRIRNFSKWLVLKHFFGVFHSFQDFEEVCRRDEEEEAG